MPPKKKQVRRSYINEKNAFSCIATAIFELVQLDALLYRFSKNGVATLRCGLMILV
jgi:hypothetical protein